MKGSKLFKGFVAAFVVIVLSGPAVVLADAPSYIEDANATVSYADLNLENQRGVRVLYQRLQHASQDICGGGSLLDLENQRVVRVLYQHLQHASKEIGGGSLRHGGSIIMKSSRLRCYRKTLSNAVDQIDNADLTRIHAR